MLLSVTCNSTIHREFFACFPMQQFYGNAPRCYVVLMLSVLFQEATTPIILKLKQHEIYEFRCFFNQIVVVRLLKLLQILRWCMCSTLHHTAPMAGTYYPSQNTTKLRSTTRPWFADYLHYYRKAHKPFNVDTLS